MKKLALCLALALASSAGVAAGEARPAAPDVLSLRRPAGPEWFGIYLVGKKAGWSRIELAMDQRNGAPVLVARSETVLQANLGGNAVRRLQRDEKVYEARPGGRLLAFRTERQGDGGGRVFEGTCVPSGCRVSMTAEGSAPETRELPASAEMVEQADAVRLAAARRGTVEGAQLDLERLRDKKMKDVFVRRGRLAGAGVEVAVSVVAESEEGDRAEQLISVGDDGRIAEIRVGQGIVARPESEAIAKRLDQVDLFGLSRIPLPGPLPQKVPGAVVFRIRGLPGGFQKSDERQRYAPAPNGETLVTVRATAPRAASAAKDAPRGAEGVPTELLEATPAIDSDAPELRRVAAEVVGSTPTVYAASVKLAHWVYRRLEKAYGASHDRATEVLAAGKGDCTEHALLFVALARAAKIPAREVHGLVYARYGDGVPALYWHAWAEVESGGEWIPIDPTFDEPVADATHIALGRGTQVDTVGLLGALAVTEARALK